MRTVIWILALSAAAFVAYVLASAVAFVLLYRMRNFPRRLEACFFAHLIAWPASRCYFDGSITGCMRNPTERLSDHCMAVGRHRLSFRF